MYIRKYLPRSLWHFVHWAMSASSVSSQVVTWGKLKNMGDKSKKVDVSWSNYKPKTLISHWCLHRCRRAETHTVQTADNESSSHFQSIEVGLTSPFWTEINRTETAKSDFEVFETDKRKLVHFPAKRERLKRKRMLLSKLILFINTFKSYFGYSFRFL